MRVDDFRYYGKLSRTLGTLFIVIGIVFPIITVEWHYSWLRGEYYVFPYLWHGVGLVVIGIVLIIVSNILFREYDIRSKEQKTQT